MAIKLDQTRPDLTYVLKSLKSFLKKCGVRRICYRIVIWPLEFVIYRIIRLGKKKYCILRPHISAGGICLYLNRVLGGCVYAELRNMIPVVDMLTVPNRYLLDDEVGHINSWEYYFEQPAGIELDEALSLKDSQVVTLPVGSIFPAQDGKFFGNFLGQLTFWRRICRKYIHFAPAVIERFERMKTKYKGRKILGLLVRGTDYVTTKPKYHPIPPTAEQAIAKVQEAMRDKNFDSVYLATEDKKILAKFQQVFGEKLILPEAQYVDYDYNNTDVRKNLLYNYHIDRENDRYLSGMEYLVSMLFLSQCKGFITSGTNGSVVVMLLSDGFDYFYFFDLGMYP